MGPDDAFDALLSLHADVDRDAEALARRHAGRLKCGRGCSACCVDDIRVYDVEAERIRRLAPEVLSREPHAPGACAFLDADGACRVYEHRPYVCRTQGLPLRWVEEAADGSPFELRDICPLNDDGEPIESLPVEACWTIGPAEERLQAIAESWDGVMRRVKLRDLFPK